LEDNLGQISTQVFDGLAALDRQNVNFASAGPDLLLPLGSRNQLGLERATAASPTSTRISTTTATADGSGSYT